MDMDEDFKLALKLSMELNGHDPLPARDDFPSLPTASSKLGGHRKRPAEDVNYIQPSKKFTLVNEDEDYQLALKLSEEINNQSSASQSNQNKYSSILKSELDDNENEDFFIDFKLLKERSNPNAVGVNSTSPLCSDNSKLSRLTDDKDTGFAEGFGFDDHDDDFLLAIKLSQEDLSPRSKVENSSFPAASTSTNFLKSPCDSDGNNHSGATSIDDFSWDNDDDEDFLLAVKLSQEDFDPKSVATLNSSSTSKSVNEDHLKNYSDQTLSVVDPSWELIDPNPDIYSLFAAFNKRFFWGKLESVEVKWSPRMTLCAGVCSYSPRAGFCSVRLSKPLLQLRPRKDLVETLLHEMIHAFLFITKNDRDRDGHGPRFHSHMYRINKESGANITVYHTFHAEVKAYKTHWWRCDGPCQHKQPFYGYVKRATNRAPGPNDFWWNNHRAECGGNFIKVKEPEGYHDKKFKKSSTNKPKVNSLSNYFTPKASTLSASTTSPSSLLFAPNRAFDIGVSTSGTSVTPSVTTNSQNRAKTILNMVNSNANVHTINTISRAKISNRDTKTKSPQKSRWAPLPGQQNIFHFINKS